MGKGLVIFLVVVALVINFIGIMYVLNYDDMQVEDEIKTNFRTVQEPVNFESNENIDLSDKTSTKTSEEVTGSVSTISRGSNDSEEELNEPKLPNWIEIDEIIPTHSWMNIYGNIYIKDKQASIGDKIAVFDSGENLVGIFEIKETGKFGFMHIYRDDVTTGNKDGASIGEKLVFRIYDKSKGKVFGLKESIEVFYSDFSKIRIELDVD